jgi:hypothetical protein
MDTHLTAGIEQGRVTDETPSIHWAHMLVDGQSRILDLGCAFWDEPLRAERLGTPYFYLGQNPAFYLGIDQNKSDIALLTQELGDHFLEESITSPAQIANWITFNYITHIKSDIEGAEEHLAAIENPLPTLQAVAIETHGNEVHQKICGWIERQELTIYRIDQQGDCPDVFIVYARKLLDKTTLTTPSQQ